MRSRLTKLELNSQGLAAFLADGPELKDAVNDAAGTIKSAMVSAIEETRTKAESSKNKRVRPGYDQSVSLETTKANDGRYKVEVVLDGANNADYIFNTVGNAVARAGGKKSRGRR